MKAARAPRMLALHRYFPANISFLQVGNLSHSLESSQMIEIMGVRDMGLSLDPATVGQLFEVGN